MAWFDYSHGKTAADYSGEANGRIDNITTPEWVTRPHSVFAAISPAIIEMLKKKKNDEIANYLSASMSAQKATPVLDQNGQMISGGGPMNPTAVSLYNTARGLPGDYVAPDLGGTTGLAMRQQQQSLDDKQQQDARDATKWEQDRRFTEAKITNLNSPGTPSQLVPTHIGNQTLNLTPDKAADMWWRTQRNSGDSFAKLNKDVQSATGVSVGEIASGRNHRLSPDGNQFQVDVVNNNGEKRTINIPTPTYNQMLGRYNALQSGNTGGGDGAAQGSGSDGTTSDGIPTVSTPEQASALPPGSMFRTPDGRLKQVPKSDLIDDQSNE